MAHWTDALIVTLIAIASVVVLGILGYWIEKNASDESEEDKISEPAKDALKMEHRR